MDRLSKLPSCKDASENSMSPVSRRISRMGKKGHEHIQSYGWCSYQKSSCKEKDNKFFEILKFRAVAVDISEWILGKMLKYWRDQIAAHPCLPCRLFSFSLESRCGVWTGKSMKEWHAAWFWFPQWLTQCVHMDISDILSWSKLDPNIQIRETCLQIVKLAEKNHNNIGINSSQHYFVVSLF